MWSVQNSHTTGIDSGGCGGECLQSAWKENGRDTERPTKRSAQNSEMSLPCWDLMLRKLLATGQPKHSHSHIPVPAFSLPLPVLGISCSFLQVPLPCPHPTTQRGCALRASAVRVMDSWLKLPQLLLWFRDTICVLFGPGLFLLGFCSYTVII